MRLVRRGITLLLLAFLVLPAFAADDKKKDEKKDDKKDVKKDEKDAKDVKPVVPPAAKDPKKDEKTDPKTEPKKVEKKDVKPEPKKEEKKDNGMVKIDQRLGQVLSMDESKKTLRLRIEVPKLNEGAVQGLAQAQQELVQAYTKPLQQQAQAVAAAQRKILENQAKLITKTTADIDLGTTEDLVVRMKDPPPKFDDKGKPARYSAKELAELKGESKLPGYKAEWADLRTNQLLQVVLVQKRNLPKPKINPRTREIDPDVLAAYNPLISQIIILGELRQGQ